jgi:hypothetical protein
MRTTISLRVFHPDWPYQNALILMLEGLSNA